MTQQRARAGDTLLGASRCRVEERGGQSGYADRQEAAARTPVEAPVRAVGGELVPAEDFATKTLPAILDTLVNPDAVAADASRDRLDLAKNAGSLELALDTADTIQAGDALERMLAHQMATTHVLAMKAAAVMGQQLDIADRTMGTAKQAACVEAARMAGAVARMNGSFQAGMQTLQRVRAGGQQTVVVQHNYVGEGGQAVIGGQQQVGGGAGRRKRGGRGAA
ncbi:hypothetical protein [Methylobacterium pseudosasicola]|uniref:Uncharacterized protein n=1 Tax=Methylobacterium pseudosasicola TaxID=582667 RepID=A0A1I4USV4_9HYPH|nr:hypothetical protein [Methylobacterium pseudosasicola]SFM91833.1 hypothetical protein SAMN05192568_10761 [Methylobacterium pseudosasicola]